MQRFPFDPPPLQRFVDPDATIAEKDRRRLAKAIDKFEKRFPQITVSLCVMRLPSGVDGREFGYWYLNRSRPASPEERARRPHQVLLTVDRTDHTVSATVGYALDCFLDDVILAKTLTKSQPSFTKQGYTGGIARWLKVLTRELVDVHEETMFALDSWTRRRSAPKEETPRSTISPRTVTQRFPEPVASEKTPKPPATVGAGSSTAIDR